MGRFPIVFKGESRKPCIQFKPRCRFGARGGGGGGGGGGDGRTFGALRVVEGVVLVGRAGGGGGRRADAEDAHLLTEMPQQHDAHQPAGGLAAPLEHHT
eukprot:1179041-Prorocentrum_minimum.AAC.4